MFPFKDLKIKLEECINRVIDKLEDVRSSICYYIDKSKDEICNKIEETKDRIIERITKFEETIRPGLIKVTQDVTTIDPNNYYEIELEIENFDAAIFTIQVQYHENANNPIEIRWFYSPNGVNFETLEEILDKGQYIRLSLRPGSYALRAIIIPTYEEYVKIQILNLDDTYPVEVYYWIKLIRWSGLHKL